MPSKTLGIILLIAGILVLAASLLADAIGIGAQPGFFGWKQIVGAVVGLAACVAGLVMVLRHTGTA